jgi:hypothetical protein
MATSALQERSQSKLGTGVREKDFGKFRAYSMTILSIPIQDGISW